MEQTLKNIEEWTYIDCTQCQAVIPISKSTFKHWCVSFDYYYATTPGNSKKETDDFIHIHFYICPKCKNTMILVYPNNKSRLIPIQPASLAKIFPEYIPKEIRKDYEEAYAILHLSPKASAALSRRCLQSMIHDFWNIHERNLYDEITQLKPSISESLWESIDSLRSLGNIGAHMKLDCNNISIDVDDGEAEKLLQLIEYLFNDWYIQNHNQEKLFNDITQAAKKKGFFRK